MELGMGKHDLLIPCAMGRPGPDPVGEMPGAALAGKGWAFLCPELLRGADPCFYSAALIKAGASTVGQVGSRGAGSVWGPAGTGPGHWDWRSPDGAR